MHENTSTHSKYDYETKSFRNGRFQLLQQFYANLLEIFPVTTFDKDNKFLNMRWVPLGMNWVTHCHAGEWKSNGLRVVIRREFGRVI